MAHQPKSARGDWVKQLRFDMTFAEKTLLKEGSLDTMFVVHTKNSKHVIATPWSDDNEKAACLDMIRTYCIAHDAEALTYLAEAWIRHLHQAPGETDAEFAARSEAVLPRDAEDRIEVVICMCVYRDDAGQRHVVSDTREIERRLNGKPSGLKPYRSNEGFDVMGGAMVEVFPEDPPSAAAQHAARMFLHLAGMDDKLQ